MKELPPPSCEMDWSMSAIHENINRLFEHKPKDETVFFICLIRPCMIYAPEWEKSMRYGFSPVFFVPCDELPNNFAWDMVMYRTKTGEPIAVQRNRPI